MFFKKNEHFILWGAIVLFYFYQYIIRILPNIIINDIVSDFQLNANQFATLGAFYLYAYSLVQIPVGLLADKYGVKKITLLSILMCILSSYMFVHTSNFYILQLSRILQGLGSACSFLCALKIVTDMFPSKKIGLFSGLTGSIGCIGAVFAGKPLAELIASCGIINSVYLASILGWISFSIVLMCLLFSKDNKTKSLDINILKEGLKYGFTNKMVWIFGIVSIGIYSPVSVLADFWATGFFTTKFNITVPEAGFYITVLYIGMTVGNTLMPGLFSSKIRQALIVLPTILVVLMSVIFYCETVPFMTILVILIGFFTGIEILCFTGGMAYSTPTNSGIIIGILNTLNAIGAAFGQQVVGSLMDLKWNGQLNDLGVRIYSSEDYSFALSSLSAMIIIGIFLTIRYIKNQPTK